MNKSLAFHSRFLGLVLRHAHEKIGNTLDDAGWPVIDSFIEKANASGRYLSRDVLLRVVTKTKKDSQFVPTISGFAPINAIPSMSIWVSPQLFPLCLAY